MPGARLRFSGPTFIGIVIRDWFEPRLWFEGICCGFGWPWADLDSCEGQD
jgi:hypothetical protein